MTEYRFDGKRIVGSERGCAHIYSWDFGDGSRGSGVTVTHVYRAAGKYEVTLTVSDGTERPTSNQGAHWIVWQADGTVVEGPSVSARRSRPTLAMTVDLID